MDNLYYKKNSILTLAKNYSDASKKVKKNLFTLLDKTAKPNIVITVGKKLISFTCSIENCKETTNNVNAMGEHLKLHKGPSIFTSSSFYFLRLRGMPASLGTRGI